MSAAASPVRVCFFFNAQRHQLLHGIATASTLALDDRFEVHVLAPSDEHLAYARTVAEQLGGGPVRFVGIRSRLLAAARRWTGRAIPPKLLTLARLGPTLAGYDAVAVPERTTTLLKRLGVRRPRFIHLDHGAGDRAAGFDPRTRFFDFALVPGAKIERRQLAAGLIRPGDYAVVGYPKFEAADAARDAGWRPFAGDRPLVLYNPHFSRLGSWEAAGERVLAAFAGQDRYDLMVAPHVRLLDGRAARARWDPVLARYRDHPRIRVDRGSDRAIDMTHTVLADLYLGDVSSQVYEFLRVPRPCLFLNPHRVAWEADPDYAHWHLGQVLENADALVAAVDRAVAEHPRWRPVQEAAFADTFLPGGGAARAAAAIAAYLLGQPASA